MTGPTREISDKIFFDQVETDDTLFRGVTFDGAELVYRGGAAPTFDRCRFLDVTFTFEGPAGETLDYLRMLAGANPVLRQMVANLLPSLHD